MILFLVLASVVLIILLTWLHVERTRHLGESAAKRQRRTALAELFGSAVCVLSFLKDRHSLSGGLFGVLGLLLLVQSVYTLVKYARQIGAEPEYRPPGAPPPIE